MQTDKCRRAAWRWIGLDRSIERRDEMKLRQMLAGFVALAAGVLIFTPGTSLAAGFQNSPTFQSASLPPTQTVPQFSSQTPATNMVRPDYIIGPDDVISVDVFQIPDLSRTVQVDSEGNILLPLLGSVPAAGRSVAQLSQQVAAAYGNKYVRDPKVTVSVKESESQKVTVNGAVVQPGIYPITSGTTLMQAIALAKGPDTKLASDRVAIFRTVGKNRTEATFNIDDIQSGKVQDPQLQAHDIVVVDTSGTRRFLQDISPIAPFAVLGAIF
jgi:polysaccharide export outer membrane protein